MVDTDRDVSTGEIYRWLKDMDRRYSQQLSAIESRLTTAIERAVSLEARVEGHDREIADLKRARTLPPELAEVVAFVRQSVVDDGSKPAVTKRDLKVLYTVFLILQPVLAWLFGLLMHGAELIK